MFIVWALLILSYLIGSIPTALIVGKLFFGVDIRELGSKNPGATNTLRVLGKKSAMIVLIIDVLKGVAAALLPIYFGLDMTPIYFGMMAVFGHCFPVFAGFRGGKAIATTAGALLISDLQLLLIAYLSFFFVIFITKYVFFGSISVGFSLFTYSSVSAAIDLELMFLAFSIFLIYLHRSNIRNFILGIEPKINDKNLKNDKIPPKNSYK